jgi:NitT/TauT family transport system permease protein
MTFTAETAQNRDGAATFSLRYLSRMKYVPAAVGFVSFALIIVAIEVLIRVGVINRFIVPMPSQIVGAFGRVITEEEILHRFAMTAGECLGATVLLTVVGVGLGLLLHRVRLLRLATETWVAAFASAPLVLMYPLFLVIFGRSALTIVMMAFVAALPPVILKTLEGLTGTRRVLIDVGRSLKLSQTQLYWKILFPAALPNIFVGVKLGMIFALINIVGVEFLINFGGLGQLINELAERYDLPGTYAAICFVILVSVCFFLFVERVERWLRPVD